MMPSPNVGLIVIATGRYSSFLPALIRGARQNVKGLRRVYVLSDSRPADDPLVTWLPWGHIGWPFPTLLRYRAITAYADVLRDSDVLVYVDVDMRFVAEFDVAAMSGVFAVRHPGFVDVEPETLPYERNPVSRASVGLEDGRCYFAGGVQGGATDAYLAACAEMALMVQSDLNNGVVPVWHDESVWNARCVAVPPDTELPSEYCTPEGQEDTSTVLVALEKNHDHFREVPWSQRIRTKTAQLGRRIRAAAIQPLRRVKAAVRR